MANFKETIRRIPLTAVVIISGVIVTVAIVAIALIPGHTSGTVVSKQVVAAHEETTTSCNMVGKVMLCLPNTYKVDTTYVLSLADGKDKGSAEVSKAVFDNTNVGTYFQQ